MLAEAKYNYRELGPDYDLKDPEQVFSKQNVMQTSYSNNAFDTVICHRLFHHFYESKTRRDAMVELQRISSDTVIISFFNSVSASAQLKKLKNWIKGKKPTDRVPVNIKQFVSELEGSGLKVIKLVPILRGISPHWIAVTKVS